MIDENEIDCTINEFFCLKLVIYLTWTRPGNCQVLQMWPTTIIFVHFSTSNAVWACPPCFWFSKLPCPAAQMRSWAQSITSYLFTNLFDRSCRMCLRSRRMCWQTRSLNKSTSACTATVPPRSDTLLRAEFPGSMQLMGPPRPSCESKSDRGESGWSPVMDADSGCQSLSLITANNNNKAKICQGLDSNQAKHRAFFFNFYLQIKQK